MNNFKAAREKNEMTIEEVASLLKVSKGKIKSWENGSATPSMGYLYTLSYLYEEGYDYLLGYEVDPVSQKVKVSNIRIKYRKRLAKIITSIICAISFLAILITLTIVLVPQIHAKNHIKDAYAKMENYLSTEANASVDDLLRYLHFNGNTPSEYEFENLGFVTYDNNYVCLYQEGALRYLVDVSRGYSVVDTYTVSCGAYQATYEVVGYYDGYYVLFKEVDILNDYAKLKDIVLCMNESKK